MGATFVSPAPAVLNGTGLTMSQAFSVPAGSNCAVANLSLNATAAAITVSSITYAGAAMTPVAASVDNSTQAGILHNMAQQFTLIAPATGSNTLAATFSTTANDWYANVVGFAGVNTATPVRAGSVVKNTNTETVGGAGNGVKTLSIPSDANDLTCSVITPLNGGVVGSTSQTLSGAINGAGANSGAVDHETTPGGNPTVSHVWTMSTGAPADGVVYMGFSLNGDASVTPSEEGVREYATQGRRGGRRGTEPRIVMGGGGRAF